MSFVLCIYHEFCPVYIVIPVSAVHSQSPVAMTVISANVEGLTASKASILSVINVHGAALSLSKKHIDPRTYQGL